MLSSKVCFYYFHRQLILWSRLSKVCTFVAWLILSVTFFRIESYAIGTTVEISKQHFFAQKIVNIEDNDIVNQGDIKITNLSQFLQEEKSAIIISTHPHRWEKHFFILLIVRRQRS